MSLSRTSLCVVSLLCCLNIVMAFEMTIKVTNMFSEDVCFIQSDIDYLSVTINDTSYSTFWSNSDITAMAIPGGGIAFQCNSTVCASTSYAFVQFVPKKSPAAAYDPPCFLVYIEIYNGLSGCYTVSICMPLSPSLPLKDVAERAVDRVHVEARLIQNEKAYTNYGMNRPLV
eukprot:TRINITY_DN1669_c0_g1_i3.p1 TRINITY_DN1669_c0_g1~~TRINITY_DN1669_c0_g1_i3.p1  ORF type:complete len:184 (+),score=40.59 TRINITY_DN1669_c0_g1_i3:38-553(+)